MADIISYGFSFTQGAICGSFIFLNHGLKLDCGHWVWQLLVDLDTADTGNTFGTLWPAIFDAPAAYRLLTALQNDEKRRVVQLSLTGCCNLTTKECHRHPMMSTRKRIAGQKMRSGLESKGSKLGMDRMGFGVQPPKPASRDGRHTL